MMKVYEPKSENELNEILENYKGINYIFRGLTSSELELTSSLKFKNSKDDLDNLITDYNSEITKLMSKKRQSNDQKYLSEKFDLECNLRHSGKPSPLMDWTNNKEVSVFFATNGITKNTTNSIIYIMNIEDLYKITASNSTFALDLEQFYNDNLIEFAVVFYNTP